jgi:hypothetical protein
MFQQNQKTNEKHILSEFKVEYLNHTVWGQKSMYIFIFFTYIQVIRLLQKIFQTGLCRVFFAKHFGKKSF